MFAVCVCFCALDVRDVQLVVKVPLLLYLFFVFDLWLEQTSHRIGDKSISCSWHLLVSLSLKDIKLILMRVIIVFFEFGEAFNIIVVTCTIVIVAASTSILLAKDTLLLNELMINFPIVLNRIFIAVGLLVGSILETHFY